MEKKPDNNPEEKFVSRRSRRKAAVDDKDKIEKLQLLSEPNSTGEMVAMIDPDQQQPIGSEEKVLTDEDMPPLDSLSADSDFSMFMSPGVSEALRRLALRKLFGRASFNIRDGLDDYDDDFRSFAALGDIITCDMKHQIEVEEERMRQQEEAEAAGLEKRRESNNDQEQLEEKDAPREVENHGDFEPDDVSDTEEEIDIPLNKDGDETNNLA